MDVSAIIYSAIGGGGGALIGVLLFSLFQRLRRKDGASKDGLSSGVRGGLVGGLAVAGGLFVGAMYKNMTLPRIFPMDDSALTADVPAFRVIKEQSPEEYKQMMYPVDRAVRNGGAKQADMNEMRAIYFELIGAKMRVASGASLKEIEKGAPSLNRTLKEKAPHICTLILNGEAYPSLVTYFTPAEKKAEQDATLNLFVAEPRDSDFVPDLEKGKRLFEQALLVPLEDMGISNIRPDVSETTDNEAEHQKICDLAIAYSENKLAMSDDDLIHLTHYLEGL